MKALTYQSYGLPEVIQLVDVPKPTPKPTEVLVKIEAASVTPADCAFRSASPAIIRLFNGLMKPKGIPGFEFAGKVEKLGSKVSQFKTGDQVFGLSAKTAGAHAEYLSIEESSVITKIPESLTPMNAVGICDGALTALYFLKKADLKPGQRILINGAGGAVGNYGVQLAKYFGAHVTGVCSGSKAEFVKGLGADEVINYEKEDFLSSSQTFDVVFDAVGKSSFSSCKPILTSEGKYLSTVLSANILWSALKTSFSKGKRALFFAAGLNQNKEDLEYLKKLVESGELRTHVDQVFSFDDAKRAHHYVEEGHKQGNVVLAFNGGI
ncbi:MAG: NAD(P)-dependent alcohol dehydrogenase [Proteobacteria bacterium]|nr:NAD(P)-dependent alcohol dehydrogenase [Pseudomonadota bacterium]